MAAPSLPIPTVPAASGALLVRVSGFFAPPRALLVPAGTRLPRGVYAVVAVPAASAPAPGSGGRGTGAIRWAVAAAAAAPGDAGENKDSFYVDMEASGVEALTMLSCIEPPAHLISKAASIKETLEGAVEKVKSKKQDKFDCVKDLLFGIYGVVDLSKECAPPKKKEADLDALDFDQEWFHVMRLAARVDDPQAVMESVTRALGIARGALRDCIGHTAAGAEKLLQFEDPED